MNKQNIVRNFLTAMSMLLFGAFMGHFSAIELVSAQGTIGTGAGGDVSQFKKDVDEGMKEVKNDPEAQATQTEVNSEDGENAGDEHGDVKEVDGENNQGEIDNEIEQEVENESGSQDEGGREGSGGNETSTSTGSSEGTTIND